MTHDELALHVEVLEARLTKLETALLMLLDTMKQGSDPAALDEIRDVVASDLEEWE